MTFRNQRRKDGFDEILRQYSRDTRVMAIYKGMQEFCDDFEASEDDVKPCVQFKKLKASFLDKYFPTLAKKDIAYCDDYTPAILWQDFMYTVNESWDKDLAKLVVNWHNFSINPKRAAEYRDKGIVMNAADYSRG